VIAFEGLVVRYPRARVDALEGVTFGAGRGRMTAVVGPNGSGKSTLVRALLGRIRPMSGCVRVDGNDVATLDRRRLAQSVAVVPQREESAFAVPIRDYIALARYPHRGAWQTATAADARAVDRAVRLTDVGAFLDRSTDELSGGEWQRVRLARALAQGGDALVLDEPTTFLDTAHEMAIFELLDALAHAGLAVLLVSHQVNLVARFADAMVLLHRGRIAAIGTPADVMRAPVLEQVYEWPLVVTHDPAIGAPALVPLRGTRRTDLA
jgi:iron complex transport system ATP-binding protein